MENINISLNYSNIFLVPIYFSVEEEQYVEKQHKKGIRSTLVLEYLYILIYVCVVCQSL